jgi:hypothetical protein
MPYSSGTFSRVHDFTSDRDAGIKIQASRTDAEFDGIATGLTTAILKDGTQTTTAVVPFAFGISIVDNKAITLGTNSDITIQYDETTNDSLEIAAAIEGAALGIVFKSDQGDDNADQHKLSIADGGTLTLASKISGSFVTYLTHTPNSTVASSTLAVAGNLTVGGNLTLGSGAELSEAELEMLDGITAGTVAASKAVVVDSNKDIASFRNITLTGELDAGSLDVSGDADIDGTLEADAMTLNGSAITTTATLSTGISNGNVLVATSGIADNDFLRVDGTSIEGRSASEVLSDIGASAVAGSSSIVTTGALDSGSITSGFGAIDNGTSGIRTNTFTAETSVVPSANDGATLGTASLGFADLFLADGGVIKFGDDQDVTITHDADDGLILKSAATGDDNPFLLTLQTGETDLAADDVIGKIAFQAPDEGTGTDAILVSAAIQAVAEGDHSASSNATSLQFMTGASEAATEKMRIDSSGNVAIGNTSPSSQYMTRLVVGDGSGTEGITIYSGNDATGRLEFSDATSGDGRYAGGIVYNHSTNKLRFNTNGGNERLSIDSGGDVQVYAGDLYFNTAGKGIVLGATSNTDSNTLDDYEEGTFTLTMNSTTLTTTQSEAQYTKIGRVVHFYIDLAITAGSDGTAFSASGMPFTADSDKDQQVNVQTSVTSSTPIIFIKGSNMNSVKNNATVNLTYSDVAGKFLRISGMYQIA